MLNQQQSQEMFLKLELLCMILEELHQKRDVEECDIYNHKLPFRVTTAEGVKMCGFLGLVVAVDRMYCSGKEIDRYRKWMFTGDDIYYRPFKNTDWRPMTLNDLIYAQSEYYNLHPVQLQTLGGYIDSKEALLSYSPGMKFINEENQYSPLYVIPSHWNAGRVDARKHQCHDELDEFWRT